MSRSGVGYQVSVVSSNFCSLVEASRYSQTSIEFAYLSSCLSINKDGTFYDTYFPSHPTQIREDWFIIEDFNYWYKVPDPESVSE